MTACIKRTERKKSRKERMAFFLCMEAPRNSSGRKCTKVDHSSYFWERQVWSGEAGNEIGGGCVTYF